MRAEHRQGEPRRVIGSAQHPRGLEWSLVSRAVPSLWIRNFALRRQHRRFVVDQSGCVADVATTLGVAVRATVCERELSAVLLRCLDTSV
ncbi:MAG: hypothetical protein ACLQUY_10680 [Ktedonobacterales bacterium]